MEKRKTIYQTKWGINCLTILIAVVVITFSVPHVEACTRVLYETGTATYIVGRSMDWNDMQASMNWWILPRGIS
jgi:penicillin V acylase-like amidase (Ntn superfamily)